MSRARSSGTNTLVPLAGLLALAAIAGPRPAHALSCAASYVRVISPPDTDAPLNARILVEVFAMHGQKVEIETIALRRKGSASPVATTRRVVGSADVRVLELTPGAPLAAGTTYEVVSGRGSTLHVAGQLTTGKTADRTPPVLRELKARFFDAEIANPWWGPGKRRHRYLQLKVTREADPGARALALWVSEGAGRIDFSRAPTTYVLDYPDGVVLGQTPSSCPRTNLALPAPARRGKLRVGVRAVDGAGNLSAPLEAEVDLRRPEKAR